MKDDYARNESFWWYHLQFDNVALNNLGVRTLGTNQNYEDVSGVAFVRARPSKLSDPRMVCLSQAGLALIDKHTSEGITAHQLCGNEVPANCRPYAHCYCGHQFGFFAGQLGDGAVVSLGECVTEPGGKTRLELQLEGCGPTFFTNPELGTGRKPIGQMVREMMVAEALAALGVPTMRVLSVVKGRDRELKQARKECAVLLRAAPSFLRVGSFETTLTPDRHPSSWTPAPSAGNNEFLTRLADHCISEYYPSVAAIPEDHLEVDRDFKLASRYRGLVFEFTKATARLVAQWRCLGCVHGMLNTDNVSVIGTTLDLGFFNFMEHTDPDFRSDGDSLGRFCLREQHNAARGVCLRFATAMQPLHCTFPEPMAKEVETLFDETFAEAEDRGLQEKLGFFQKGPDLSGLVRGLLAIMEKTGADWTCTFQAIVAPGTPESIATVIAEFCERPMTDEWEFWLRHYSLALSSHGDCMSSPHRREKSAGLNPVVVPRRWMLERAERAAEEGDCRYVRALLKVLTDPFTRPDDEALEKPWMAVRFSLLQVNHSELTDIGVQAIEFLEKAEYWRELCPELKVNDPKSAKIIRNNLFFITDERAAHLRRCMERDGVFTLEPEELPWQANIANVAMCMERLHEHGWPPTFILAYDEPWIMAAQLSPLMRRVTGNDVGFDWLALRIPAGKSGIGPHRKKLLVDYLEEKLVARHGHGFRVDGTPRYAGCWVPVVDVPATSSCLMCLQRKHDPGYLENDFHPIKEPVEMQHIRPLPLSAGGAVVFSHRLYHWSKGSEAADEAGAPCPSRLTLTMVAADDTYDASIVSRRQLPLPPLHMRVALASGQTFRHAEQLHGEFPESLWELIWNCFLACDGHFEPSFARGVREAWEKLKV